MVSLLILFAFSLSCTEDISGIISTEVFISGADVGTYTITGPAEATLSKQIRFFKVGSEDSPGGKCEIDGKGNTITLKSADDLTSYKSFIVVYDEAELILKNCSFDILGININVLDSADGKKITIEGCSISGSSPYYFAGSERTGEVVVKGCTFQNMVVLNTSYFGGYILGIQMCGKFTLENSTFTNITGAKPQGGTYIGFMALVALFGNTETLVTGCKFVNCSGLISGAIAAYDVNNKNTYKDLVFAGNSFVLPEDLFAEILPSSGAPSQLVSAFGSSKTLGNDLTRVGSGTATVSGTCSNSTVPHYRNGTTSNGESFSECTEGGTEGEGAAHQMWMPSMVILLVLSMLLM